MARKCDIKCLLFIEVSIASKDAWVKENTLIIDWHLCLCDSRAQSDLMSIWANCQNSTMRNASKKICQILLVCVCSYHQMPPMF